MSTVNSTVNGKNKKMVSVTRWPAGDVHFQMDGRDVCMKDLRAAVLADMEGSVSSPTKIDTLDVYVKPADGRAYYAATGPDAELSGSVAL